ncbi:uncharacterized protein PHACADRAFT_210709 [Phanerochaete carnosa HHB-10118-sp]|uniref:MYND-type domain-containing protein n=1 Tax=Phanerochaete carnosa (strain HHB-10118-sp) TaxID=650164 RepID=K5USP4_PHACS|nr:uncharacterized protein PHACADRAFT_210709 [Phanerochaete carnosa HHB-10118-sp]EKM52946.1 hypothetical protein PHACADRAFT_210709 [Phanerochaete carnosa HHB-10118-sp]
MPAPDFGLTMPRGEVCQQCQRRKGAGVKLSRCTGCKYMLYCSKECQRAAWPFHKRMCGIARACTAEHGEERTRSLDAFVARHRDTLFNITFWVLEGDQDMANTENKVLWITVKPRPEPTRRKGLAWIVVDAEVRAIDDLPEETRTTLVQGKEMHVQTDPTVVAIPTAIVQDEDTKVCGIMCYGVVDTPELKVNPHDSSVGQQQNVALVDVTMKDVPGMYSIQGSQRSLRYLGRDVLVGEPFRVREVLDEDALWRKLFVRQGAYCVGGSRKRHELADVTR